MRSRQRRAASLGASLVYGLLVLSAGCRDEPPPRDGPEPMRKPPSKAGSVAPERASEAETTELAANPDEASDEQPGSRLPERPPADPEIERALAQISASGLRFIDQASEPEDRPSEYTAEQFAVMLRTKWDWIGYDLTEVGPWLDAIATRSFKTHLAYQVVLANGTRQELRPWLDAQLGRPVQAEPAEPEPEPELADPAEPSEPQAE